MHGSCFLPLSLPSTDANWWLFYRWLFVGWSCPIPPVQESHFTSRVLRPLFHTSIFCPTSHAALQTCFPLFDRAAFGNAPPSCSFGGFEMMNGNWSWSPGRRLFPSLFSYRICRFGAFFSRSLTHSRNLSLSFEKRTSSSTPTDDSLKISARTCRSTP